MVWICTVCNGKNYNSSVKCRKNKCHAPKPEAVLRIEQKIYDEMFKRDYCPTCKMHQDFIRKSRKNQWSCGRCHKLYKFKGKPVPEVKEEMTNG